MCVCMLGVYNVQQNQNKLKFLFVTFWVSLLSKWSSHKNIIKKTIGWIREFEKTFEFEDGIFQSPINLSLMGNSIRNLLFDVNLQHFIHTQKNKKTKKNKKRVMIFLKEENMDKKDMVQS
jgi:hypothetical protein